MTLLPVWHAHHDLGVMSGQRAHEKLVHTLP